MFTVLFLLISRLVVLKCNVIYVIMWCLLSAFLSVVNLCVKYICCSLQTPHLNTFCLHKTVIVNELLTLIATQPHNVNTTLSFPRQFYPWIMYTIISLLKIATKYFIPIPNIYIIANCCNVIYYTGMFSRL